MKKLITILFAVLFTVSVFGQAPQKISYQAVIRDAGSVLITSTVVGMQISILQGSPTGTLVYVETQTPTTNINGLVSVEIGGGIGFDTINWANGPYFIKTETDPLGGTSYTISGTSQLLSVPYALYSKTAENISGTITENDPVYGSSVASGITGADITNWNNKLDVEVDGSVTNELQVLSISNDTVYLTNGGFVKLPAGFDGQYSSLIGAPTNVSSFTNDAGYLTTEVDGSVVNELQALSISNDTVYLTNGGFVKLPAGFDGQYSSLTGAPTNVSSFTNDAGYLTTEVDGSVVNELQALSLSNDTIYLSNGGFVKLPTNNWSLLGNSGIVDGTNFIGTTNNVPFTIRVNNQRSGYINNTNAVTFFGYQAGLNNSGFTGNTAFGYQTLRSNVSGANITGNGYQALYSNTTGNSSTANGMQALYSNVSGGFNTALGQQTLYSNTIGSYNTATGNYSLYFNVAGSNATAIGYNAMYYANNQAGAFTNYNVAVGFEALRGSTTPSANTGNNNTAIGYQTLWSNTTGNYNTANGRNTLFSNTTGSQNTANGGSALQSNVTGNNNTALGYGADVTVNNLTNATAIGYNAKVGASNSLVLGGTGVDGVNVGIGTMSPSYPLHVQKSAANIFVASIENSDPAGYGLEIRTNSTSSTKNALEVYTGGISKFLVRADGNVGIGTTAPTSLLHVKGTADPLQIMIENVGGNFKTGYGIKTALQEWFIGQQSLASTGFRIVDVTNLNAVRLQIEQTTGNVGIGTATPGARLEVNGNLLFTGSSTVSPAAGLFNLTVRAGDGPASGGTMTIRGGQAGSATGGAGGNLELQGGGNMPSGGAGYGNLGAAGAVNIIGGSGYNSTGGNVSIAAGATSCWALGGAVHSDVTIRGGMNYAVADAASIVAEGGYVSGGCSGNSTGGNLILKAGVGQGAGQPGKIQMIGLPVYANNAAAIAGGLTVGSLYRTGADPDPVCIVH